MKKLVAMGLVALTVLMVTTSAYALPDDTILIGNKAFSIFHLTDSNYDDAINEAVKNAGADDLYYQLSGNLLSLVTNKEISESKKATFENVLFIDQEGKKWIYKTLDDTNPTEDGEVPTSDNLEIIDVY